MKNEYKAIAYNLKRLREDHGLNQDEFGAIAGVSRKAVSTWELGIKVPRMGAIQKLSDHFGIPKSQIIDGRVVEQCAEFAEEVEKAPAEVAKSFADVLLDAEARSMMSRYTALNNAKQKQVREFVRFLSEEEER